MRNVICITEFLNLKRELQKANNPIACSFIEAINDVSNIVLSEHSSIEKLYSILPLFEKINNIFLNINMFKQSLEKEDKVIVDTLIKLKCETDTYFDIILEEEKTDNLPYKISEKKLELINIVNDYMVICKKNIYNNKKKKLVLRSFIY